MANGGNIRFGVGFDVNTTELNQLKASLQEIQRQASQASGSNKMTKELQESAQAAQKLEKILDGAWNSKLQQFNLNKVNSSIKSTYGSVSKLKMELEKSGAAGATAFNKLGSSLLTTNTQLKQSSKLLDNMAHTMSSTIRWGIASSVMNSFTNSIQKAWSYSKNLDTSLNDIRIVTEATADQMDRFAITANKAAKELGANTLDFTKASLIYYQQGLSDEEVAARAETTVKAANVTGQTGDEVSEQLTAVWNGYKVSAEEAELYVDKLAAVAASTASDLEELSTGMSKVASAASTAGVDIDQLNATLATVVSVTRQAPESVGTAFKTIYARLGDLRVDGVDEFGTTLGEVSGKLQTMGVDILDQQGNMRDMGEVVEEVAGKWATWTDAQKQAAAVAMAGKRQYNNLIALFENWDMYESSLQTSANAAGTLQKQQDIYMESTAAHLKTLQAETQRTYDLMFETDSINGIIDVFDTGLEYLNNFIEGLDGGANALMLFGSMFANIFSKQISASILRASNNIKIFANQFKDAKFKQDLLNTGASTIVNQQNIANGMSIDPKTAGYQAQLLAAKQVEAVTKGLTQEEYQQSLELNKQIGLHAEKKAQLISEKNITKEIKTGLAIMKADENTNIDSVKKRVAMRQTEAEEIKEIRLALVEMQYLEAEVLQLKNKDKLTTQEQNRIEQELLQHKQTYMSYLSRQGISEEQSKIRWNNLVTKMKEGTFRVGELSGKLSIINTQENQNNQAISAGLALIRAKSPELEREYTQELAIEKSLNRQVQAIHNQGKARINTQKFVNAGMAAVGVLSSLSGVVSVLNDDMATGEQRAHAWGSALSGIGMSAGMAFGPAGMIVGGLIGSLGNLIFQTELVENAFKSTEEKMEELHQKQQEGITEGQNFRNAKQELESIAEEYEELSEKAGEYDKTIENLTDEELNRYNELKDIILKYNPEALLAYDSEGNAILKKNEAIQETIDLLKEQYELETQTQAKTNWESYKETFKEAQKENEEQKKQAQEDQSDVSQMQNQEEEDYEVYSAKEFLKEAIEISEGKKVQDTLISDAFEELENIINDPDQILSAENVDAFIKKVEESGLKNSEEILDWAEQLKEATEIAEDKYQDAQDAFEAAVIEEDNLQVFDSSAILSAVKDIDGENKEWNQLESLNLEGTDALVQQYVDSLKVSDKIPDAEAAKEATQDYIQSLYDLLINATNPEDILNGLQNFDESQFTSIEEYNQAVITQMQSLIDDNSDVFEGMAAEEKTNLLKALYGVSDVTLDGEGNINQIANDYKTTLQDKFSEIFSESAGIEGALLSDSSALNFTNVASNFLGPEEIENFDAIWELTDKSAKSAGELMQNLEKAAQTWREQQEELKFNESVAANGTLYAEEYDIDEEQYKNLSKIIKDTADELEDLSNELLDNGDAVQEVAKDILRYDKAVESVKENSKDWMKILKSDNLQDQADIVDDLADAYGNMFDIDGSELSSDFLTSVDNLELLKQAANGSEEAYNQLRAEMGKEILAQVGIDASQYEQDLANLNALALQEKNMGFADIEAGASLNTQGYLDALSDMVTKAGMTAEQATDYLSSMGIDAEVTTADKWQEEIIGFNTTPTITPIHYPITPPLGLGEPVDYTVPMVTYQAKPLRRMKKVSGAGLRVTSANKSAGGGVKFSNSSHGGGASGGSGGSGGGGGSSSQPKTEKKIESKFDRYHDVNKQLEDVANELEEIEEEQERLFGEDLIDSLTRQKELLQRQKELQEEKLNIAREEQKELQDALRTQGVQFDKEGFISNYEAIIKQKEAEYNALIDQYNAMSAEEQDTFKENVLDPAKETLDKFYEDIEAYDEILTGTIPEIEKEIREAMNQEIEANVDKFNLSVELRLEVADLQEQWSEFKKDFSLDEDDIFGNALEDFNLYSQLTSGGNIQDLTNHINRTMESIQNINNGEWDPIFGDNKQLALEELEGYIDSLMDSMLDVKELQEAINESYLESIDAIGDAVDKQAEKFEQVNDLLEHNMNIVKLLNGEDAYKEMTVYYEKMKENNLQMLANSKQAENYYREELEKARKAGDEDAAERWTELWEAEVAKGKELLESSIETLIDSYTNSINVIFDELNDKLTDGKGLNYVNLEWELNNENQDAYLDNINAEYEMQQLERKYRDSIDSADGIKAQRELNKLMDEELSKLREKDKLTQYDIDRANARYELKLKEIALEEAQQNKSQMRLRRDSSGGYSYQFVADQDGISQAQQELDEARNSLYNMDKDQYRENQQEILDIWNEFQEKMRDSANMSAEEKELIEKTYMERINNLINENNVIRVNLMESAMDEMANLYDMDVLALQNMSDAEQAILMDQVVPNWNSSVQSMIDKLTGESEDSLAPAVQEAFSQMTLLTQDFDAELAQIEETAGISFAALEEGYDTNIDLASKLAEEQQKNIDKTIEQKEATQDLRDEVNSLAESYKAVFEQATNALDAAIKLDNYEKEKAAAEAARLAAEQAAANGGGDGSGGDGSGGGSGSGGNGGGSAGTLTAEVIDGVAGALYYWSPAGWGNGTERKNKMEAKFGAGAYSQIQSYINQHVAYSGALKAPFNYGFGDRDKYKQYFYDKFDTGGYTGDWNGDEGRTALLHKKELVLNRTDTENILSAVGIVRDMEAMLNSLTNSMASRISGLTNSLMSDFSFTRDTGELQQNVQIEANFPNVSDRAEIEEAFENLVNMASQHAYNTQR